MSRSQNLQLILKRKHGVRQFRRVRFNYVAGFFAVGIIFTASLLPYELHFSPLTGRTEVVDTNILAPDYTNAEVQGSFTVEEGMGDRYVIVSLANQTLEAYENGERVFAFLISTGSSSRPTPAGKFTIKNKHPRAYSRVADAWMPYWMAFHYDGEYWLGFHELAEWPDGRKKEGWQLLGQPRSGGCIRIGVGAAEQLYNWAEVGDKVLVY